MLHFLLMKEGMEFQDISQISHAFWENPERSVHLALETVSMSALLDLNEDCAIERMSMALLKLALRDGVAVNGAVIQNPFYRLNPIQRFILVALHQCHWSYARLSRILEVSPLEAAQTAWASRLVFSTQPELCSRIVHPTGSLRSGVRCPEYNEQAPWTQKFLDNENTLQERLFLQEHLQRCDSCKQVLERCRRFYYTVGSLLPCLNSADCERRSKIFQKAYRQVWVFQHPLDQTFLESLSSFFLRQ